MSVEKYLLLCEQLGEEPDPSKMPLDASVFPYEVQVAFFILEFLPDVWEGMSGTYMGKDWSACEFLFNVYEVEDKKTVLYFMKLYDNLLMAYRAEEAARKRKVEEQKTASGGKSLTHNVRG